MFKLYIQNIELEQQYLCINFECECHITFKYDGTRIGYRCCIKNNKQHLNFLRIYNENNNSY